jgi:molybdopterin-containing oxidoreductase family iron-sulfur binding subunit
MDRREFVRTACGLLVLGASSTYAVRVLTRSFTGGVKTTPPTTGVRWGMVIDLTRCREGCTACIDACREENNVAFHGDSRWNVHWIRKAKLKKRGEHDGPGKPMILLCNHCDNPPCAQVCPVQATYKRHDGIVVVDHHRCIGCRYCMIACPYNARFFNFKENEDWPNKKFPKRSHGVAEGCTLCAHLLEAGRKPACVAACEREGGNVLSVGDLDDPTSNVSRLIAGSPTKRIRDDLGTEPKVYYIGL